MHQSQTNLIASPNKLCLVLTLVQIKKHSDRKETWSKETHKEESVQEVAPHNTSQLNCISSHNRYKYLIKRSVSKIIVMQYRCRIEI
jgi:hypothetical protein